MEADKRPHHRLGGFVCCGGRMIDSYNHYSHELNVLNAEVCGVVLMRMILLMSLIGRSRLHKLRPCVRNSL